MAEERDFSELTPMGKFVYDRLTMPDRFRTEDDPVRQSRGMYGVVDPCCMEHQPNKICIQEYGHG